MKNKQTKNVLNVIIKPKANYSQETHSDETWYSCNQCDYQATHQYSLQAHTN